jgi:hypothetical protein
VSDWLRAWSGRPSCEHYHAGMSRASRSSVARRWKQGELRQMGATIAFGMGAGERRHLLAPATPPLRAAASPGASAPQTQPTTPYRLLAPLSHPQAPTCRTSTA